MKKLSITLMLFSILFVSCQKELKKQTDDKQIGRTDLVKNASCKRNEIPFNQLFTLQQDNSEKNIDLQHYHMIKNILGLSNNSKFKQLLAQSRNRKNNTIYMNELGAVDNSFAAGTFDTTECNVEHNGLYYKSILFVANADACNFELSPIMSPGIELYDDDYDEQEGNHDVIFAWYVDEYEDTIEINIGEGDVSATSRPIVVASLELCEGQEELAKKEEGDFGKFIKTVQSRTSFTPVFTGLQINYRYDNTKYSEVLLSAVHVSTTALINSTIIKLTDVHKNNVGTYQNWGFDRPLDYFSVNNTLTERICFNAFEYDWYASYKDLGFCYYKGSTSGTKINLNPGRRKFQDEWYSYIPGDLSNREIALSSLTTSTQNFVFDNSKGSIGIKKQ